MDFHKILKFIDNDGSLNFSNFLEDIINVEKLKYKNYIKNLIYHFGRNNIYIYRFDYIKNNISSFINEICDFIGVKIHNYKNKKLNIGYSLWQLKFSMLMNNFFKTPLNPKGIVPLKYKWHPHRILFQSPLFPKQFRGNKVTLKNLNENFWKN